jgi:hypothetical protein
MRCQVRALMLRAAHETARFLPRLPFELLIQAGGAHRRGRALLDLQICTIDGA